MFNIKLRLLLKFLRIFSLFIHMYKFNSHGGSFLSQGIMICKILNLNYNVHADAPTQALTLSGHMVSESF